MSKTKTHYTAPVSNLSRDDCYSLIRLALDEDAPGGDPTSEAIFSVDENGCATVITRESGVLCGISVIRYLLEAYQEISGTTLALEPVINDGQSFSPGDRILVIQGSLRGILRVERIILNFLQYLSGISTTVNEAVQKGSPDLMIVDTRKTLPGYRKLAKYAVYCGGGTNHRIHLSDMILIKDNHIAAAGSISQAIEKTREARPDLPLEVEVDTLEQLREIIDLRPDFILLDNMGRDSIKQALEIISVVPENEQPGIEVSGGWRPDRFSELKDLGPLRVSMSYLTATTRFLDLSLEID